MTNASWSAELVFPVMEYQLTRPLDNKALLEVWVDYGDLWGIFKHLWGS